MLCPKLQTVSVVMIVSKSGAGANNCLLISKLVATARTPYYDTSRWPRPANVAFFWPFWGPVFIRCSCEFDISFLSCLCMCNSENSQGTFKMQIGNCGGAFKDNSNSVGRNHLSLASSGPFIVLYAQQTNLSIMPTS